MRALWTLHTLRRWTSSERPAGRARRRLVPIPACIIWHCVPEANLLAGPRTASPRRRRGRANCALSTYSRTSGRKGSRLFCAPVEGLRQIGNVRAHLWVAKGNDRAITFYDNHGSAPDDQFRNYAVITPPLREPRISACFVIPGGDRHPRGTPNGPPSRHLTLRKRTNGAAADTMVSLMIGPSIGSVSGQPRIQRYSDTPGCFF